MTRVLPTTVFVTVVALVVAGCGSSEGDALPSGAPAAAPAAAATGPTGTIRGIVKLEGVAPAPRNEPVGQNQDVCGQTVPVTHAHVGSNNGLRQAFVYLENVPSTAPPAPQATLEVGQERCVYTPHTLVVPMNASVEIVNGDPILHNVHAREQTPEGPRTVFNIAQPVRGQRTKIDKPFTKPGVITLTCEAGHPWMTAHVLVANHPYVGVTAEDGTFTIENVPAGTYPITMWHEGISLTRVLPTLQRYEYEEPYQVTQHVEVTPGGEAHVTFALAPR